MAMSFCRQCNTMFTGLGAFDAHLQLAGDERGTMNCLNPLDIGLVAKYNGSTLRGYGRPATETPFFNRGRDAANRQEGNTMETTLVRKCEETGKPFVAWGKGRPPTRIGQGRAQEVVTPIGNVGKWIDREGNVYDERPEGAPAKPAKAKPKGKAPAQQDYRSKNEREAAKPATAKAVKQAQPVQPAKRIAMPVPPPPPAAVVGGKTLVQELAEGTVHPDTFAEPPHAEDSYASLYGEDGVSPGALERPEPDDYMHDVLVSGSLRGYSLA